ncbi:MAG: hypothetical protein AAF706_02590, partial [Bacteroidota bacterium]
WLLFSSWEKSNEAARRAKSFVKPKPEKLQLQPNRTTEAQMHMIPPPLSRRKKVTRSPQGKAS